MHDTSIRPLGLLLAMNLDRLLFPAVTLVALVLAVWTTSP
ncbi:hypothetical protein SAMN04488567_0826 [Limimaricola pyoseonensis]|uniref:Uncharacterized protein n=1 Tax=Limimaricola pyoseonensis TaxID=521013 RepID=A0A1G7A8L2_9RHOB|nr:hypothetical protein SAMN04488567_0826 [Limimaricola pyoseonensis]